ncbi:MAG: ParA family protein [Ndongobacter sp.]|nr:ParA family protein [Ndongobacter sp.]
MSRTICVYNQKGGVGKTTTVINLAAALGILRKKVLVVDMDPQGNTTSGLGIDKRALSVELYDALNKEEEIAQVVCATTSKRVRLLPSTSALTGFEIEAVGREHRERILKDTLEPIRERYDYVLIDCPPSLGLLSLNALCASGSVLIPIQTEYYALEGVSQLVETIDMVRSAFHPQLAIEGVLLTLFDGRNNLATDVMNEVKKYFADEVFDTIIPRSIRLAEAPSYGESVLSYDRKSKGAQAYLALAREVIRKKRNDRSKR